MKLNKVPFLFFLLVIGLSYHSHAQSFSQNPAVWNDTMLVMFRTPLMDIVGYDDFGPNTPFTVAKRSQVKKVTVSTTKELRIPRRVRRISNPFLLTKEGACYQIGAVSENGPGECLVFWLDKNKDRQVQPQREIRSGNKEDISIPCTLRWREVTCP